jgi:quercetin dioxygenase-like cupin family protein
MKQISKIQSKEIAAGITGKYIHGTSLTFGYVHIKAGSILNEHHHIHEQITYIVEGELEMNIGGERCVLSAGSVYVIPPNTPHSATAQNDCIVIDVFCPTRDDYRLEQ